MTEGIIEYVPVNTYFRPTKWADEAVEYISPRSRDDADQLGDMLDAYWDRVEWLAKRLGLDKKEYSWLSR